MNPRRFTTEEIIAAYQKTGSVWAAAKLLGACGQSIWEGLKAMNYPMAHPFWSEEELDQVRSLASSHTITEIAQQIGRPYSTVASKISAMGIGVRFGNRIRAKKDPAKPMGEDRVRDYLAEMESWNGSIRQFCRHKGIRLERLVIEMQRYFPSAWDDYVRSRSVLPERTCPSCSSAFIPMTAKQVTCTRKCATDWRVNRDYFGGKRDFAAGISSGLCLLCGSSVKGKLSAHHVFGKENDPEHDSLIGLCHGCHHLVGSLAGKSRCNDPAFWEGLIAWAMMRHQGKDRPIGFHVWVEIEPLAQEDIEEDEVA